MLIGSVCAPFIHSWVALLKLSVYFVTNKSQETLIIYPRRHKDCQRETLSAAPTETVLSYKPASIFQKFLLSPDSRSCLCHHSCSTQLFLAEGSLPVHEPQNTIFYTLEKRSSLYYENA